MVEEKNLIKNPVTGGNSAFSENELSASTNTGKEIIKVEISQKLVEAKEKLVEIKLNQISQKEIREKLEKELEKLDDRGIVIAYKRQRGI